MSVSEACTNDPIEAHITDLTAALHGPARVKMRMVAELREGLVDAAQELSPNPESDRDAARQAVHQFGTVAKIAPIFQRELTIAQARHTARTVMLIVPVLMLCWYLVEISDRAESHRLPVLVQLLVAHLGGIAALTAFLGGVFLP